MGRLSAHPSLAGVQHAEQVSCACLAPALLHREDDLETSQFTNAEAQAEIDKLRAAAEAAQRAQEDAEVQRDRAVGALDGVRAEAAKALASADRHQEV